MISINSIIETLKYIILGIVQGFFEPLPVSSSGHMILIEDILNITFSDLNFKIIVNFASFIAIIIFYRKFIFSIIKGTLLFIFYANKEYKKDFLYFIYLIVATIPASIIGFLFEKYISLYFTNTISVCFCLIFTAVCLFIIEQKNSQNNTTTITLSSSINMGLAQIIGLIPGVSRSGVTSCFGVLSKVNVNDSFRFSFMMYLPISIGALLVSFINHDIEKNILSFNYFLSFVFCIIFTYISLSFFSDFIKKKRIKFFANYCLSISLFLFIIKVFLKLF